MNTSREVHNNNSHKVVFLGVSSAQAPVFKAIVVIIIVVIQAEPAKAFFKKLTKKSGKEAARA